MPRRRHPIQAPDRAERDRSPDAQAAVPDVERLDRIAPWQEIQLRVGEHVVKTSAHDPERDGPQRDVGDVVGITAAGLPPPLRQPDRHENPSDDAQRVRPDRDRAQMPDALARAGQIRQCHRNLTLSVTADRWAGHCQRATYAQQPT